MMKASETAERFRAGKRLWSASDDALLRHVYPDETTPVLARRFRRSLSSIYQ